MVSDPPHMVDDVVARIVHLVVASLWAGSVFFVALVVLPQARAGAFKQTEPLAVLSGRLTWISRISAVVLLVTGGHLAGTGYTADSLVGSPNGQLVLLMTGLWLALTALVEVGAKRFEAGLADQKLRAPARDATVPFQAAAAVAVALMVVAGAITTNAVALF